MRNIVVDGSFLARHYAGCGTNRYLVNLLRAADKASCPLDELRIRVVVPHKADASVCGVDVDGLRIVPHAAMQFKRTWRLGLFLNTMSLLRPEVVFLPSPVPVYLKPRRLAVTVHDLIPLLFPDQFRSLSGRVLKYSIVSSVKKADLIFTDSEHSKGDLVSTQDIPEDRVVVAPLGFDSELFNCAPLDPAKSQAVLHKYGVNQPYLLHVGAVEPRKNLVRLTQGYRLLLSRQKSVSFQLVICGRLGWGYQDLLRTVGEPDLLGRVVMTGPVSDQELAIFYKSSQGSAMPSLYEGFGLPLLEAMACGVPVASSDRSCLPEIGGDAPIYFNPESIEDIADAIERLLTDTALRESMIRRGLERAKLFTWEDCARKTLAALLEL